MKVVCVLRSGGLYTFRWVRALRRGLEAHHPGLELVCLTDLDIVEIVDGIQVVRLEHGWPGWWSKLEMFRLDLFEPGQLVMYTDLDALITDRLDDYESYEGAFALHRGFYRPWRLQSALMLYRAGREPATSLWKTFVNRPGYWMRRCKGDGDFIHLAVGGKEEALDRRYTGPPAMGVHHRYRVLEELYPGRHCSFKLHARSAVPHGVSIVMGHGDPRFSSPDAGWGHTHWRRLADGTEDEDECRGVD